MEVLRSIVLAAISLIATVGLHGSSAPRTVDQESSVKTARLIQIWAFRPEQPELIQLDRLLHRLELGYRSDHPDTTFAHRFTGNDSAVGGVYMGAADIALMSRAPSFIELDGYQQVVAGRKPFMQTIMRGGSRSGPSTSALVIVVNRHNPLRRLSRRQLKSIFSGQCASDGNDAPTWAEAGLKGSWASRPLHIYGFDVGTVEAEVFSELALGGSGGWSCAYREVRSTSKLTAAQAIRRAVEQDPSGIGLTTMGAFSDETTVVAIDGANGKESLPDAQTLASGQYPLGRSVIAVARMDKSGNPDQNVRGFVEYLVSERAAKLIETNSDYVPARTTPKMEGIQ